MTGTKPFLSVREMCMTGVFGAVTAVLSPLQIPLPFTPIPISLGVFAVFLTGLLLGPKSAVLAQVCYLVLGMAGLPVFAGFRGGFQVLAGPTGGYLAAYPLVALVISASLAAVGVPENRRERLLFRAKAVLAMTVALVLLYLFGAVWFMGSTGTDFARTLALTVLPFIPFDLGKMAVAAVIFLPVRERLSLAGG